MKTLTIKLQGDSNIPEWHTEINIGGEGCLNKEVIEKEDYEFIANLKREVSVFLLTRTKPEYPDVEEDNL